MPDEVYCRLKSILSKFTHVHAFIDDDFILEQCEGGLKNYLLGRLANNDSAQDTLSHLPTLERRLVQLAPLAGYYKLQALLQGASNWDAYQEALAQLDIILWFNQKKLVKEIEPILDYRVGKADILLSLNGQDMYCEITSFQSIIKSINLVDNSREKNRHSGQAKIDRVVRILLKKTNRQLPPDYPGILALDALKSGIFAFDVRLIAQKLLPQRLQVALIALWSGEGTGPDINWDIPNSFFINSKSQYRYIGEALLQCMNVTAGIEVI
jgi:hypothetical protein